jgi:trk system potassium uptake protein TrkA
MRIVITGAGRAGLAVAAHLRGIGHDVVIVDRDENVTRRAFEQLGVVAHAGDATDASLLAEAGIERADVVVAMLHRDADNLAVALLASSAGAKRVMVRVRDPGYRSVYEAAGVQRVLSEVDVLLGAFVGAIEFDAVTHSMFLGDGRSVAVELALPADVRVGGKSVSEVAASPDFPSSCVLAGLVEPDGNVLAPRGNSILHGGTTLVLVARRDELAAVVSFFLQKR